MYGISLRSFNYYLDKKIRYLINYQFKLQYFR